MKFNMHYDMIVDYNGHIEARTGIHVLLANNEVEALSKAKKFFNNESILDWDAILEGNDFVSFLER